jgi:hypothetical protein
MDKPPAKRLICKEKHPVMQKFNQLCALADDLGINISFCGHRTILEHDGERFDVEDIENSDVAMSDFPPATEVLLAFENPAYIAYQEELATKRRKEEADKEAIAAAKRADEKAKKDAAEKIAQELAERKQYAKLKEKYGA